MTADDRTFLHALCDASLPNERFHHADHLRATYLFILRSGYPEGANAMASAIRRFAHTHGADEKFHLTLTMAWARLVAAHVVEDPGADFEEFIARHPRLADKTLPLRHYSSQRLFSDDARCGWREPDVRPLPSVKPWKPTIQAS